jgi:hypothetical protein
LTILLVFGYCILDLCIAVGAWPFHCQDTLVSCIFTSQLVVISMVFTLTVSELANPIPFLHFWNRYLLSRLVPPSGLWESGSTVL